METFRQDYSSPVTFRQPPDADWRHQASCVGVDLELFFPLGEGGSTRNQVKQAKAICASCPVNRACLDFALRTGLEFGIFGGQTESERRGTRDELNRRRLMATPISHTADQP